MRIWFLGGIIHNIHIAEYRAPSRASALGSRRRSRSLLTLSKEELRFTGGATNQFHELDGFLVPGTKFYVWTKGTQKIIIYV